MKKTVSVNIKGTNFLIEEDAYELLQDYLDRLTATLRNDIGSKEIIEDVELRIAEICSSKLSDSKSVIELADIQEILTNLGDPSDYIDEDPDAAQNTNQQENTRSSDSDKRMFRDKENSVIAGVCQGIANFFRIDVIIIRAIFVIFFLFAGFGLPLYIILWIIIPKAKSSIDRLRSKGKPVTVESVKEEVENAADRIKESSKNFTGKVRNNDQYKQSISRVGRILSSIVGIGLILWGLVWLVSFLVLGIGGLDFIPALDEGGLMSISDFGELVLANASDVKWAWIGGLLLGFSAILFLLLLGSMFLFRLRNRWSKLSLLGLLLTGIVGLIMCIYIGAKTTRDFVFEGEIEQLVGSVQTDELTIIPELNPIAHMDGFDIKSNGRYGSMKIEAETITSYGIHFTYKQSKDSLFHVYQNLSAQGRTHKVGLKRAKHIDHSIYMKGDTVIVKTDYSFPREDKLRDQDVYVIIEIPSNGLVRMNNHVIRLGEDPDDEDDNHRRVRPNYNEDGYLRGNGKYRHEGW